MFERMTSPIGLWLLSNTFRVVSKELFFTSYIYDFHAKENKNDLTLVTVTKFYLERDAENKI